MMRYQRVSPDYLPLSNGKKSTLKTTTTTSTSCNGNGNGNGNGHGNDNGVSTSSIEGGGKGLRFRSPSRSPPQSDDPPRSLSPSPSPSPNRGDVLLQWGQKKRARVSRTEIRSVTDESSSSSLNKLHRRIAPGGVALVDKLSRTTTTTTTTTSMPPPPPPPPSSTSRARTGFLNNKDASGFTHNRNLEERSGAGNGSPSRNSGASSRGVSRSVAGKRSPPTPEKIDKKITSSGSAKDEKKPNGSLAQADHVNHHRVDSASLQSEQQPGAAAAANTASVVIGGGEKANVEVIEWPRIYVSLSRKEKEDDFLAMKGTKLPQRPKKRAKNVDRTLQYCFPGMWLSDLTKGRYEVREKKCVKKQKQRRGLKGMESMESDSE